MAKMTDRQSKTLFVRNLAFTTTTPKLIETFEDVGPLKTAFIVADKESGKCKGYGYVQFSMLEDAVKAKNTISHCDGRKLSIAFADAKKDRTKKQSKDDNGSPSSNAQEQRDTESKKVQAARKKEQREKKPLNKRCRIILRNLPFKCKESDIQAQFEKFGTIAEINIPLKKGALNRGFAFVQYTDLTAAQKAMAKMNAQDVMGRPVAVDWAVAKDRFVADTTEHHSDAEKSEGEESGEDNKASDDDDDDDDDVSDSEQSDEEEAEEKDDTDSEESDEEDDEDDDEDEEEDEDEEKEQEPKREKMKVERQSDVGEGRTLFIRNVPFLVEEEEMEEVFGEFGDLVYVRLVTDKMTGQSRGTAFVQFAQKESAEDCLAKAQSDNGGGLVVRGRQLLVVLAITRTEAEKQKTSNAKEQKDSRNLFLAREGMIRAGTQAAAGVSEEDMKKRMKVELVKREKLKNLNVFVSSTRLCIHNLLPKVDEKELRKVLHQSVDDSAMKITECRVMRDLARTNQSGSAKSLGFAFVNFSTHEHALKALHALNNSAVFGNQRRPIVEFSLENKKALEAKQKRLEKSRAQAAKKQQEKESDTGRKKKPKVKADKTQDRIAKDMHRGAPKGMPKRFGPKIRHKKREQQQKQQQGKKQKKQQQQQHQKLNRPNQQPKPKMMKKKKQKKEVRDNVDRMISKHQGKKGRWFEAS